MTSLLQEIRDHLGFDLVEVAAAGGWSRSDLLKIERGVELSLEDGLRLETLYGVNLFEIVDRGHLIPGDIPASALLKGSAETLTATARFAITEAISVARDIVEVRACLGGASHHSVLNFSEDDDLSHPKHGAQVRLSNLVRERLGLRGVIRSMIRDVLEPLGIVVFGSHFSDRAIDAVSLWSEKTGPIIIVNWEGGQFGGALGLRTALAHELCHLLFDRAKMRGIAQFCEVERPDETSWDPEAEAIEQRARAFQAEFLAPQSLIYSRWVELGRPEMQLAISSLSRHFGLGPVATGWQLFNGGGPRYDPMVPVPHYEPGEWDERALLLSPPGYDDVPEMRRGLLLSLVRDGYLAGKLSGSWARELLRVDSAGWDQMTAKWTSS